jgi:hypothetical protein
MISFWMTSYYCSSRKHPHCDSFTTRYSKCLMFSASVCRSCQQQPRQAIPIPPPFSRGSSRLWSVVHIGLTVATKKMYNSASQFFTAITVLMTAKDLVRRWLLFCKNKLIAWTNHERVAPQITRAGVSSCWVAAVLRRGRTAASLTVQGGPPLHLFSCCIWRGWTLRVESVALAQPKTKHTYNRPSESSASCFLFRAVDNSDTLTFHRTSLLHCWTHSYFSVQSPSLSTVVLFLLTRSCIATR